MNEFKNRLSRLLVVTLVLGSVSVGAQGRYDPTWASLDARPTPAWFLEAKFGIFIHWGVYSVPAWGPEKAYSEWYWRNTFEDNGAIKDNEWGAFHKKVYGEDVQYSAFAPQFKCELFDPDEWADVFAQSGAKYVVLTSKHHDGFCLWPSPEANKSWGRLWNSVDIGPRRDLVGDLTNSVRKAGLKMGLYYSLYEWFNPLWRLDRERYVAEHMIPQFKDVVMRYKPSLIFSDGEWDMPDTDWKSTELLAWLYNESPARGDVIVNDRWGKGIRHTHGGYYTTEYGAGLAGDAHPWEENRGIGFSFGYNRNEPLSNYRTSEELVLMLVDLVSRGGNLLLDVGPTADGRIPAIMQSRLIEMGQWLKVNGEAIYGTQTWGMHCQWSAGEQPEQDYSKEHKAEYNLMERVRSPKPGQARIEAFFTYKPDMLYVIVPTWPGGELTLRGIEPIAGAKVQMLGVAGDLPWTLDGQDTKIDISGIGPEKLPCQWAWTFKVPAKKAIPKPAEPKEEPKKEEKKNTEDRLKDLLLDILKGN